MSKIFADAVVIGGGAIGASISYYLTKAGKKPLIIEQNHINAGASGACDEAVLLLSKSHGIMMDMAIKSAQLYKNLENELDADIGYRNNGGMILINNETHIPMLKSFVKKQQAHGLDISLLDKSKTHTLQPGLSSKVIASVYSKNDCSIYPFHLTLAYIKAAKKNGAKVLLHNKVSNIQMKNKISSYSKARFKVITPYNEISTPIVINAAGVSADKIGKMVGLEIPVSPTRGQIIITEQVPHLINSQIIDADFVIAKHYLAQQHSPALKIGLTLSQSRTGNLIIGGCREQAGIDTNTSFSTIRDILKNAASFFPVFEDINMIRTFAGLRPSTPDHLPIIAPTSVSGFYIASGLGGDGLSLAPIVGKIMSEIITKNRCEMVDVKSLCLERFE